MSALRNNGFTVPMVVVIAFILAVIGCSFGYSTMIESKCEHRIECVQTQMLEEIREMRRDFNAKLDLLLKQMLMSTGVVEDEDQDI